MYFIFIFEYCRMSQHYHYLLRKNSTVPGLDYKQVQCLQQKRLLAFVNHFVTRTADFLSTFASQCEQKLDNINQKISRLENEMALLEFKLDSVPRLRSDTLNTEPIERNDTNKGNSLKYRRSRFQRYFKKYLLIIYEN